MSKKIVIATGGSGGHVLPAQNLACQLLQRKETLSLYFVGGKLLSNPYLHKGHRIVEISCAPLKIKKPHTWMASFFHMLQGYRQSLSFLKEFAPDYVIGFGSYYIFPLLLAAHVQKVPIILHEANTVPGRVVSLFASKAHFTATYFPLLENHLLGRVCQVKMPLRDSYRQKTSKQEALAYFGLPDKTTTLLVFGGSQGAHFLNQIVLQALKGIAHPLQVIHMVGKGDVAGVKKEYEHLLMPACVRSFEERMDLAWRASDLALTRAGASTIAEAIACCVPLVMIPYPFAASNHQYHNARFMQQEVGGGCILSEKGLTAPALQQILKKYIANQDLCLTQMRHNLQAYKGMQACDDFVDLILQETRT